MATRTRQQEAEQVRQLEEARQKSDAIREKVKLAVHIDNVFTPDDVDYEKEIKAIADSVQQRSYFGKFPDGVIVHGYEIHPLSFDFETHGDKDLDIQYAKAQERPHLYLVGRFGSAMGKSRGRRPHHEILDKDIITVANDPDGDNAIVSYIFPTSSIDRVSRPNQYQTFNFLMDREHAAKLLGLIRKKPDTVEMFIQQAADGFQGDFTTKRPGIDRTQSDEIIIANLDQINPDYFNPYIDMFEPQKPRFVSDGLANVNVALSYNLSREINANPSFIERYQYATPH